MTHRILIDTNIYSALMAGSDEAADVLGAFDVVLLSPIVYGELLDGFRGGKKERENRKILEEFCAQPRTTRISVTEVTAEWFAEIKHNLKAKGTPIPINDVWIAASSMEHGAVLFSYDAHFEEIDMLMRYRG
ncbi:MAG: type II toxin-antitoxin system VapC family toxin [Spirochaetia bacterium]